MRIQDLLQESKPSRQIEAAWRNGRGDDRMKVALIGATGMIGSRILEELILREHLVTAIARDVGRVPGSPLVTAHEGDIYKKETVLDHVRDCDVLVSALSPDIRYLERFVEAQENIVEIASQAGLKKIIVIGGAGNLKNSAGIKVMETDGFPEAWKGTARIHEKALQVYRNLQNPGFIWISVSPANMVAPGKRTGKYRLSLDDTLVTDENGVSYISAEDFSVLIADLVEYDEFKNQRLAAGSR